MLKNSIEFSVLVNGKPLREYFHNQRYYVEGRNGSDFDLYLRNNSSRRVEVVFSVDGLDVLDGKTANSKKEGYLINAWGSLRVPGWRLNLDEIARFQFSSSNDSYAAKQNAPRNVGVIGVAIYYEKYVHEWTFPYMPYGQQLQQIPPNPTPFWYHQNTNTTEKLIRTCGSSQQFSVNPIQCKVSATSMNAMDGITLCSTAAPASAGESVAKGIEVNAQGLGTSFGNKTESKVHHVAFTRANAEKPDEIFELRYNDRAGLEKLGIKVAQPIDENLVLRETAKPFEDISGGCTPPAGWRG